MKDLTKIGFTKLPEPYSMVKATARTNPFYSLNIPEYTENCQRCVIAYELLRRGYTVTARQANPLFDSLSILKIWKRVFAKVPSQYVLDTGNIIHYLHTKEIPEGRYATLMKNKDEEVCHFYIIEKKKNRVYGIDPQTGERGILNDYVKNRTDSKYAITLYRLDNAEFNSKMITRFVRSFSEN